MALLLSFALLPRLLGGGRSRLVGQPAPDFALQAVANAPEGKTTLHLADLRGRPVVLDFWATWCGPCRAEAPILDQLSRRFQDTGALVVGVNTNDEPGLAEAFAAKKGLSYPIVYDDKGVAHAYDVHSFPTLVFVDKEGKVAAVRSGVTSDAEVDRLLRQLL